MTDALVATDPHASLPRWRSAFLVTTAALAVGTALHVGLAVDPALLYHAQDPVFAWSARDVAASFAEPGGPVTYASLAVGQLHALGWPGAAAVGVMVGLVCLAMRGVLRACGGAGGPVAACLPAVPLVALHADYGYPPAITLSVLGGVAGAWAYARAPGRSWLVRAATFVPMAAAAYVVLGGGGLLLCAALAALRELAARRVASAAVCVAVGAGLPALAQQTMYLMPLSKAYLWLLPPASWAVFGASECDPHLRLLFFQPPLVSRVASVALVALAVGSAAWTCLCRRRRNAAGEADARAACRAGCPWARAAAVLVLAAAAGALAWSPQRKGLVAVDYRAHREAWAGVLAAADGLAWWDTHARHDINRALRHRGALLDEMFAWPQRATWPGLVVPSDAFGGSKPTQTRLKRVPYYLELGRVNRAEHMATDAWHFQGDSVRVLWPLATCSVLKGRPEAAAVYLRALARQPLYAARARARLAALEADPTLAGDPEVAAARALAPARDTIWVELPHVDLPQLLAEHPRHRAAAELLAAWALLVRNLDGVAACLPALARAGYGRVPLHVQEALLLRGALSRGESPVPPGVPIDPRTRERFAAFLQAAAPHGEDREAARPSLAAYGDTYWYYHFYGVSRRGERLREVPLDGWADGG